MPPERVILDSSDEDMESFPISSFKRPRWRSSASNSEIDELAVDSDADDEPAQPTRPRPRLSSRDGEARRQYREKKRARAKEREEKHKRRKAVKKAAAVTARQNGGANGSSRSRATRSPQVASAIALSTSTQHREGPQRLQAPIVDVSSDSDAPLPSLVVRSSTKERSQEPSQDQTSQNQPQPISEDEVELIASQSVGPSKADKAPARASSVPTLTDTDQHEPTSQRYASALPQATYETGDAADPIQLDSSDVPPQPAIQDEQDVDDMHSVSSVWYSDSGGDDGDGEDFYTSSEGSLCDTDEERKLGSWTKKDQMHWQGTTEELDEAYGGTFDVRAVLRHRKNPRRKFTEYRVVWAGYPIHSSTWEQESNFDQPTTLQDYWTRQGGRPSDYPEDTTQYSAHDSDTDIAVRRRPRQRAHEALRKKRLEIRRDRYQLREYLRSLNDERAMRDKEARERFEKFRREKRVQLDLQRTRQKGSTRGNQKRLEQQQKRWRRSGGDDGTNVAGTSRFSATQANRALADISMKARPGAATGVNSARMRASQLNDSIPDNDESIMTFRRRPSGPGMAGNFPGLDLSMAPVRDRPGYTSSATRPTGASSTSTAGLPAGSGSTSSSQAPPPRPVPGSYKGAHRREPKVQVQADFGSFLHNLHHAQNQASQRKSNSGAAQPLQAPTDSNGQPITTGRRASEARKPNLLVVKPLAEFKGGSRPASVTAAANMHSSASSEAEDNDAFGIPEMSAVRSQFNPHQDAPDTDDEAKRAKQAPVLKSALSSSIKPAVPSLQFAPRSRVEDPRRRPAPTSSETQGISQVPWSPPADDVQWSPHESGFPAMDAASTGSRSPMPPIQRSPLERNSSGRSHDAHQVKVPQNMIWNGWFEFVVGHNQIDAEGALYATAPVSQERMQTLGLATPGGTALFNMFMPFALIRDMLVGQAVNTDEVMLLNAHGLGARQARSSLDQLSEQLKDLDVALLAYAGEAAVTGESTGRKDYFVAFSSKYDLDYISGISPSLRHVRGQPYTLCIVPLQLEQHPAPSLHVSFEKVPALEGPVDNIFEAAYGKKDIEDLSIGRNEIRKVKHAARRYRITIQLYECIRSAYNIIFLGQNPSAYEKSVLYYMVRIFGGGARLGLDDDKDAKLWKESRSRTNVFVRRAALEEMPVFDANEKALWLAPYLRRFKRQLRCRFWTYGFSSDDADERVREIFPGRDGLVTISASAILVDLLRSSMAETDNQEQEEGQLTQTDKTPPESILCNVAYHLADNWKVRIHPWVRTCFKLLADHLEPVCRALHLIEEDQQFPMELIFDLDAKLEALYTSALVEEWPVDEISGLPFEEPSEVPDEPQDLIERIDNEVFATLRKAQLNTAYDTRFHVLVSQREDMSEEQLAGIEVVTLTSVGNNISRKLAELPGN